MVKDNGRPEPLSSVWQEGNGKASLGSKRSPLGFNLFERAVMAALCAAMTRPKPPLALTQSETAPFT